MKNKDLIISHYKVINEIGKGNKGIVYKVNDLFTGKILALKLLFPEIGHVLSKSYIRKQFFRLINFEHKNLVKIYNFGISDNKEYYFTMEYIEGKSLKEVIKVNKEILYQIIFQVCQGLYYLDANNLIHFNIKPSNIMLIEKNENIIEVKLLDFGLSQYNIIDEKDIIKSINYIAPEIIKVKKVDRRADFYSLGAILYKLLTGKVPFSETKLQNLINHYLEKQAPSLRDINPDISLELENMTLKLLSKNPNNRYNNALDIIREINTLIKKSEEVPQCVSTYNKEIQIFNVFIGRRNELNILEKLLIENLENKGKLLIISGEPGIGKTYLLQRFKSYCQLENALFIIGQCDDSNNISYKPVIEILQQLIIILENKQRKDITKKYRSTLIKLIPELKNKEYCKDLINEKTHEIQSSKETEKTTLVEEIYEFLLETRKLFPYVIVIEDFHLVDSETLDMIQYFSVDSPLLIFVTCREEEIDNNEKLKNLMKAFNEDDFYKELILKRFNFSETKLMINFMLQSESIGEKLINLVYKNTSGNPFFLREEIISLISEHILYRDEGEWVLNEENYKTVKLSSNVKELIGNRIKKLDSKVIKILEILSIVRMKIKEDLVGLISEILNLNFKEIQKILNELISNYILVDNNNLCGFYHPRTKEVVESNIDDGKKRILHQKIGEVLEQRYKKEGYINSKLEELAYHFVNGSDKEKALSYSLRASEITENICAHHKTIEHYRNILSISDTVELKKKLVSICEILGKYDEAINYHQLILEKCKDRKEKVNIYTKIVKIYTTKGNYQKALFYFDKAKKELSEFKQPPQMELSKLHLVMGEYYYEQGKLKEALLECEKSLEVIGNKDCKISLYIYSLLGGIFYEKYNYEQSLKYFRKCLKISKTLKNKRKILQAHHNIGVVYTGNGKINKAIDHYNECLKNKAIISKYSLEHIYCNLGLSYLQKKDYDLANFNMLKSLQIAKQIGYYGGIIDNYLCLGELYYEKKMYNIALDYLNKSLKLSNDIGTKFSLLYIYLDIAKVYLDLNEIDESFKYCQKVLELVENGGASEKGARVYRVLGLIYQKKQDYQKAEEYFKKSEELLTKLGQNIALIETHQCMANFYKKKTELHLEKAVRICEKTDLVQDYENIKNELKWIKEGRTEGTQKYKILYEISQMITSILALNQLLPVVVDKMIEVTKAERGFLFFSNKEGTLDLKEAHKSNRENIKNALKKIDWNVIKEVSETEKSVLVTVPLENNSSKEGSKDGIYVFPTIMCTPLQVRNKIIGIIYVDSESKKKIFSNTDLDFFETFANQIAISIENAILYEESLKFKTINQLKIAPFDAKKVPKEINKVISASQKIYKVNINKSGFGNMIGTNLKMLEVYNLISKVAAYDINVLILGESGTGKELVSEEIHRLSKRKTGKLVKINAANLNKDLLESELFGYEKGAFTGAYKSKKGKLELADKGTLFLDEIGEIPFELQSKLLRTLETKNFYKVGGNTLMHSDFRLICATNSNLKDMVVQGKFREDLYYRIHTFIIKTPPLKERKEDIFLLFKYFIENNKIAEEKGIKHISENAWQIIKEYDYPGNVRELLNILEGAIILCEENQIRVEHLSKYVIEKVKESIKEKYQKILGDKKSVETHHNEKDLVNTQHLVETHHNAPQQTEKKLTGVYYNGLAETPHNISLLITNLNSLLTKITIQKINLQEKGCIQKFHRQIEKSIISYTLKKVDANVLKLSRILNISYSTLKRRLENKNYTIDEVSPLLEKLIKLIETIIDNSIANNKKINLIFDIEKKIIEITLEKTNWKKKDVSILLDIDYRTLKKKLIKYKIIK